MPLGQRTGTFYTEKCFLPSHTAVLTAFNTILLYHLSIKRCKQDIIYDSLKRNKKKILS